MRRTLLLLTVFVVFSAGSNTFAQDKTQTPKPADPPASSDTEKPKTEVDKLLEEAKKRGDVVLARCLEDCDEKGVVGDLDAGHALELPKPAYPPLARAAHVSGSGAGPGTNRC